MTAAEFKPHGFIGVSNTGSIEVMLNKSGDGVYYRFNHGQDNLEKEEIFEAEILHNNPNNTEEDEDNENTDSGFLHGDIYYSLSECMRIAY